MIAIKFNFPLIWPGNIERTPKWDRSINQNFKHGMNMEEALMFLKEELEALPAQSATLLTDYQGLENPRAMKKMGQENGVVLRLKYKDRMYEFACDRWVQVEHNVYAIHLVLRNLRTISAWGVGTPDQPFGGFAQGVGDASPNVPYERRKKDRRTVAGVQLEEWRLFLGLGPTATIEDAHAVYRRRAKLVAENQQELTRLNLAMDAASKALNG